MLRSFWKVKNPKERGEEELVQWQRAPSHLLRYAFATQHLLSQEVKVQIRFHGIWGSYTWVPGRGPLHVSKPEDRCAQPQGAPKVGSPGK